MTSEQLKAKTKGFTLIELLVVISIIGLLSAIVFASLSSARGRARDAERLSTIKQIQKALLQYYDDHGEYPGCPDDQGNLNTGCTTVGLSQYGLFSQLGNGNGTTLVPKYIPVLSNDPLNANGYGYYYALGRKQIDGHSYEDVSDSSGFLDIHYYVIAARLEGRDGDSNYPEVLDGSGGPAFGVNGLNYLVSGE